MSSHAVALYPIRFIEHGEYRGNLYGTTLESVRELTAASFVPVINPHPMALKRLKASDTKPFVILVKPPSFEKLKASRTAANAKSSADESSSRAFTDQVGTGCVRGSHCERARAS